MKHPNIRTWKYSLMFFCWVFACQTSLAIAQINLEGDKDAAAVSIKDISALGAPLNISGRWLFKIATFGNMAKTNYQEQIALTNISDKKIIAYVVEMKVVGPAGPLLDEEFSIDSFFETTHELLPGQRFEKREPRAAASSDTIVPNHTIEPHAEAKVIFVQFDGGATFGDREAPLAAELLQHRAKTLDALQHLSKIAKQTPTVASPRGVIFEDALSAKVDDGNAERTIEAIRKVQRHEGTAAAMSKVEEWLQTAAKRGARNTQ